MNKILITLVISSICAVSQAADCVTAKSNCNSCDANDNCISCSQGFYINTAANPDNCASCDDACSTCTTSGNTNCLACSGYYGVSVNNNGALTCVKCSARNCTRCTSDYRQCSECNDGYYLNGTGTSAVCDACIPNCLFCTNSTTCDRCEGGVGFNQAALKCFGSKLIIEIFSGIFGIVLLIFLSLLV